MLMASHHLSFLPNVMTSDLSTANKNTVTGVVKRFFAIWWPTYDRSKNIFQKRDLVTNLWPASQLEFHLQNNCTLYDAN